MLVRVCGVVLGGGLAACAVLPDALRPKPTILGEISFDETGAARVHECGGTRRTLLLATMAEETTYTRLRWRYAEISRDGQDPVLVEVAGIQRPSDRGVTLEDVEVVKIKPGLCDVKRAAG